MSESLGPSAKSLSERREQREESKRERDYFPL